MFRKIRSGIGWLLLLLALFFLGRKKAKKEEKTINWLFVKKILEKELGKDAFLYIVDEKYYVPALSEIEEFIKWWLEWVKSKGLKWTADFFDCDNWSILFSAMCSIMSKFHSAIANSKVHSYNLAIDLKIKTRLIEPQNGQIFSTEEYSKLAKKIMREVKPKHSVLPLPEIQTKVKTAVSRAAPRTIGKPLADYINALFEELEKEGIADRLEEVYKTGFVYYP